MSIDEIKGMSLLELEGWSALFDGMVQTERDRLDRIHDGGYYFIGNGAGMEMLSPENAKMMIAINDEIARRKRIAPEECKERIFIKRALRRAQVIFEQGLSTEGLRMLRDITDDKER